MTAPFSLATACLMAVLRLAPFPAEGAEGAARRWIVPTGQEERILSLVAPNRTLAPVLPGTWFDSVQVQDSAVIFTISGRAPRAEAVEVRLSWDAEPTEPGAAPPWRLEILGTPGSAAQERSVALFRTRIEERLTPEVYAALLVSVSDPRGEERGEPFLWIDGVREELGHAWPSCAVWQTGERRKQNRSDPRGLFLVLLVAAGLFALGLSELLLFSRGSDLPRRLGEVAAVGGLSLLLRVGLAAPRVSCFGGGRGERLLRSLPGEEGLGLLISWLLPRGSEGSMGAALILVAVISGLAPPLLVLLGRALQLPRVGSLLAGLILACWPLHVQLSASDLLAGPILTMGIAAWAFGAAAISRARAHLLLPAAGLLALAIWCRPDGALLLLPMAGILRGLPREWRLRPEAWGAGLLLGLSMAVRLVTWPWGSATALWSPPEALAGLAGLNHGTFPWWLLALMPGLLALRGYPRLVFVGLLALAASGLSVLVLHPMLDSASWLEAGALLLPWAALAAAVGLEALRDRLPGMWPRRVGAVTLAGVLVVPFLSPGALAALGDLALGAWRVGLVPLVVAALGLSLFRTAAASWRERERGDMAALLTAAAGLAALHLYSAPFLGDIKPSFGLYRPCPLWHWFVYGLSSPPDPRSVAWLNLVFGGLALFPAWSVLRRLLGDRRGAFVALFFLALSPVFVKFTAATGPQILLTLLFLSAADRVRAWTRERRVWDMILAGLLLGACAVLRAEALAFMPAVILLGGVRWCDRPRGLDVSAFVLPFAWIVLPPLTQALGEVVGEGGIPWLSPWFPISALVFPVFVRTPYILTAALPALIALTAGTGFLLTRRSWRGPLARLGLAAGSTSLGLLFVDSVTDHRYIFVALAVQAMFVGSISYGVIWGLLTRLRGGRLLEGAPALPVLVSLLVLAVLVVPKAGFLAKGWPHTREYTFLVEALPDLPPEATILYDGARHRESGLTLSTVDWNSLVHAGHRWVDFRDAASAIAGRGEAYLYLGVSCWIRQADHQGGLPVETFEGMSPHCRRVLSDLSEDANLVPVNQTTTPGTSFLGDHPNVNPIPLVLYRIVLK